MGVESAFVPQHAFQLPNDPVGKLQSLDRAGLLGLFGRHLFQSHLSPDAVPSRGIDLRHRAQVVERKFALGILFAVTTDTMGPEKWPSKSGERLVDLLSGRV